ncbi:WD40 repeat domain-containing protein [Phytomonospora endophytica]|uniref:WD40 repeat protein n=1 Tax=Phytomonospora endophytica TaxID=714109 RepID=A0A841FCV0_9ACTN|nr:WD40 repeat domain-containing protein [Phytomonospora endophytica]MBB6033624.1 WD40 repeat protein [Phytomonospora endophytica]GIG64860.1 hypothetical protein Pen01_11550 [Phytomonospora endophytica]
MWSSLLPKGVTSCPPLGNIGGHTGWVSTVATTVLDGRAVAVTASGDKTVRVWDLSTGEQVGAPWTGHTNGVRTVALSVLDGREVVVSGGDDETIRVWDLASGKPVGEPLHLHADSVQALAVGERQGRRVVVTGCYDHTVRVWDLETREEVMAPFREHTGPVYTVATAVLDGRWVAVTGGGPAVHVWDLETGEPVGKPFTAHTGYVGAIAVGELPGGQAVVISGGYQTTTRVSDLATGLPVGTFPRPDHLEGAAITVVDGRIVAVLCVDEEPAVQLWDLATMEPVGELFPQHTSTPNTLATAVLDGRQVVVSTCSYGSIRVSELVVNGTVGKPVRHDAAITAVATTSVAGRPVVVTGSEDRTVRVWDLDTGDEVCPPLTGHTGAVTAVAATEVDGRGTAVTGDTEGEVRTWDLAIGKQVREASTVHRRPITAIGADGGGDMPRAITAGDDKTIRVWDLRTGEETGKPRKSDHRWVQDLAVTALDERPVAVLGRWGGGFKVRDLASNRDTGLQTTGGNGKPVRLVAATVAGGRSFALTADDSWPEPWVKVWDVAAARQVGPLPVSSVEALAATTIDGHPVAVTTSGKGVEMWNLTTLIRIRPDMRFPEPVRALAATPDGRLIVCFDRDVAVFPLVPTG